MWRYIIRIYEFRTFFNNVIFCWMNDINKTIQSSGVIAVPSGPKSHTFTVILAVFALQPRWHHKPWKGLFTSWVRHMTGASSELGLIFVQFSTLLNKGRLQYFDMLLWQNKLESWSYATQLFESIKLVNRLPCRWNYRFPFERAQKGKTVKCAGNIPYLQLHRAQKTDLTVIREHIEVKIRDMEQASN